MVRTIIQWFAVLGAALTLSACVESSTDPFAGKTSLTPLPDKFMAVGSTDNYVLERDGDHYVFDGEDSFGWLRIFPLTEGQAENFYYVVQVSTKGDKPGYTYTLGGATANPAVFELTNANHGTLAASLRIANPYGDDNDAILEDPKQIADVLAAGLSVDEPEVQRFTILDYAIPEQRAKAKELSKQAPGNG